MQGKLALGIWLAMAGAAAAETESPTWRPASTGRSRPPGKSTRSHPRLPWTMRASCGVLRLILRGVCRRPTRWCSSWPTRIRKAQPRRAADARQPGLRGRHWADYWDALHGRPTARRSSTAASSKSGCATSSPPMPRGSYGARTGCRRRLEQQHAPGNVDTDPPDMDCTILRPRTGSSNIRRACPNWPRNVKDLSGRADSVRPVPRSQDREVEARGLSAVYRLLRQNLARHLRQEARAGNPSAEYLWRCLLRRSKANTPIISPRTRTM